MKTILTILVSAIIATVPQAAQASEWGIFGKNPAIGEVLTATVPVGSRIISSPWKAVSLETVNGDSGVVLRLQGSNSSTGISVFVPSGTGSVIRPGPSDNTYPAIRIKVISIDFDRGSARLEVSQFWPYPNEAQIDGAK